MDDGRGRFPIGVGILMRCNRISEVENQIGAGLIEEVIQVAEGELKLVDKMIEYKAYVSPRSFLGFVDANKSTGGRS